MSSLEIVTVPDPILRRKAKKVTEFDQDFQNLVDNMIDTMRVAPGVGLAAPQVGVSSRLVVVEYAEHEEEEEVENSPKKLYVLANPEIIKTSEEIETGIEGCLSVPDLVGEVDRHIAIVVRGQNRRGQAVKLKASGWLARIFQHEIDHIDGVLYTDRASRLWKPAPEEEHYIE